MTNHKRLAWEATIGCATLVGLAITLVGSCTSCIREANVNTPPVNMQIEVKPPPMQMDVHVPENKQPVNVNVVRPPRRTFRERRQDRRDNIGDVGEKGEGPEDGDGAALGRRYDCDVCLHRFDVASDSIDDQPKCPECGGAATLARWTETIGGPE